MIGFIITVLVTAVSLLIFARISIGLEVDNIWSALVSAVVLGLLNAALRPILGLMAFPITLLIFGIISIILNGIVLWLIAALLKGFHILGFQHAIIISVLLGIVNVAIFWALGWFGL